MSYYVRFMRKEDLPQVVSIDREAFPTQWPPTNYRHELENRLAHYVVVSKRDDDDDGKAGTGLLPPPQTQPQVEKSLLNRIKNIFIRKPETQTGMPGTIEEIAGFAGCWIMADEAHITEIAVKASYREKGLGELLMVSIYDLAKQYRANFIVLEARVSNLVAQNLYRKFGFNNVGVRKAYYSDNKEDAVIMSTENIRQPKYETKIQELRHSIASRLNLDHVQIFL